MSNNCDLHQNLLLYVRQHNSIGGIKFSYSIFLTLQTTLQGRTVRIVNSGNLFNCHLPKSRSKTQQKINFPFKVLFTHIHHGSGAHFDSTTSVTSSPSNRQPPPERPRRDWEYARYFRSTISPRYSRAAAIVGTGLGVKIYRFICIDGFTCILLPRFLMFLRSKFQLVRLSVCLSVRLCPSSVASGRPYTKLKSNYFYNSFPRRRTITTALFYSAGNLCLLRWNKTHT